jgi:hypothetical protein
MKQAIGGVIPGKAASIEVDALSCITLAMSRYPRKRWSLNDIAEMLNKHHYGFSYEVLVHLESHFPEQAHRDIMFAPDFVHFIVHAVLAPCITRKDEVCKLTSVSEMVHNRIHFKNSLWWRYYNALPCVSDGKRCPRFPMHHLGDIKRLLDENGRIFRSSGCLNGIPHFKLHPEFLLCVYNKIRESNGIV